MRKKYAFTPAGRAQKQIARRKIAGTWDGELYMSSWDSKLRRSHGITEAQYNEMLKKQGGCCAICGTKGPGRDGVHLLVDHDHETGKVRGLLCHNCNVSLGLMKDDIRSIERMLKYLKEKE